MPGWVIQMEKIINHRILRVQILVVTICLFLAMNVQAQNKWMTLRNGVRNSSDKEGPQKVKYEIINGEMIIREIESPKEIVKIIVILKDNPLAQYKTEKALRKISLTNMISSLKQAHSEMIAKIDNIARNLSSSANFQYSYKIHRQYYTALNGMAMECNRGMIQYIRQLSEVKSVHIDREVEAYLTRSVKQIRADIVQDSLGYSGDGILVGVIDTGIDFEHPALGGGFGPGFRVIGGYDFINDDSNPYDDHGHGTHVTGIIGANGNSYQIGVAPNVNFLAVKVLDNYGMGLWSGVIAGIEYCMDPDGIPETDDAVDIINISLGGPPEPDNPVDAAVDNATLAGILSVVAAGNRGNDVYLDSPFQTIGSPGTAVTALTVGACDSTHRTGDFSSRGPDAINFTIKPEISAPGVDIFSLFPNNSMKRYSGTSMAAPHVAGVAALLKEQHPDWTPGQIKAVIVNSAKNTGESLFHQGNGCVDALNAATLGIIIEPGIANFGLVDLSKSVWVDTVELKIKNLRNSTQHFNLENKSDLPAAVVLNLSQTSFELSPMEEKTITAIISVPSSVPRINTEPFAYTGSIICQSDSDRVQIPFGFIKSYVLVLEFDIVPTWAFLMYGSHGDAIGITDQYGYSTMYTLTVGNRNYTLWAWISIDDTTLQKQTDYYIVRDSIKVEGLTYLTLHHREAEFAAFHGLDDVRDIDDNPISVPDTCPVEFDLEISDPDFYAFRGVGYIGYGVENLEIFLSAMDQRFKILQSLMINHDNQSILLSKYMAGVQSQDDLTFLSGPQNLADLHLNFDGINIPQTRPYIQLEAIEIIKEGAFNFAFGHALPNLSYIHFMANKRTNEFNPMRYLAKSISLGNYTIDWDGLGLPLGRLATADFYIDESSDFVFYERKSTLRPNEPDYTTIMTYSSGDTLSISRGFRDDVLIPKFQFLYQYHKYNDLGLVHFNPSPYNDGGISCPNGMRALSFNLFPSQGMSRGFDARMYSRNCLLENNSVPIGFHWFYYDYTVEEDANWYRLLANTHHFNLLGQRGRTTIDYEFNVTEPVGLSKCFVPSLDWFQILEEGKPAQWLHPGKDKKVRLVIFDPKENVDSVSVYLLKNDGSEIGLTTRRASQKEVIASIPDDIPEGFLDVIAGIHNGEGNKFELTVSPAFYSGSTMDSLHRDARIQMIEQTMENPDSIEFNPGDTLNYTLTYFNYGNIVAKDITVHFPETDYFIPVGKTSVNIDSMRIDLYGMRYKYEIPLKLVFLGKKQPDEKHCYYYPTITWRSGERSFTRKQKILVDFEGPSTHIGAFENIVPNTYDLSQNFPNPFNPSTTIRYTIPQKSKVILEIFNTFGQKVATLVDDTQSAGKYELIWKPTDLPSGVYLYRLNAGRFSETKKLVLLR